MAYQIPQWIKTGSTCDDTDFCTEATKWQKFTAISAWEYTSF